MILVTGASGFIGSALCDSLGETAVGLSRSSGGHNCDLTDENSVRRLAKELKGHSFTCLIHAAAITPWSKTENFHFDEVMAQSVLMLSQLLEIPYIINISGWNVYDATGQAPFLEEAAIQPIGEYGESKYRVEHILDGSSVADVIHLRLASVYGPGQMSRGLIPNIVTSALKTQQITIGDSNVKRDYLYIGDVTRVICQLARMNVVNLPQHINLGSGASVTISSVAEMVQQICKNRYDLDVVIKKEHTSERPLPADNQLDITKARTLGLLNTITPFNEGLAAFIRWKNDEIIL